MTWTQKWTSYLYSSVRIFPHKRHGFRYQFRQIRKIVFESGIKEVFRLVPDTSEIHRPATPCGAFTRILRCYLFRDAPENRRLETEFP